MRYRRGSERTEAQSIEQKTFKKISLDVALLYLDVEAVREKQITFLKSTSSHTAASLK
jgi:hypothetical protein